MFGDKIPRHVNRINVIDDRIVFSLPSHVVDEQSFRSVKVEKVDVNHVHPVTAKMIMAMPGFNIELKTCGKFWTFARGDGMRTAFGDQGALSLCTLIFSSLWDCDSQKYCERHEQAIKRAIEEKKSHPDFNGKRLPELVLLTRRRILQGRQIENMRLTITPPGIDDNILTRLQTLVILGATNASAALEMWKSTGISPAAQRQMQEVVDYFKRHSKDPSVYVKSLPRVEHAKDSVFMRCGLHRRAMHAWRERKPGSHLTHVTGPLPLTHRMSGKASLRHQVRTIPPRPTDRVLKWDWQFSVDDAAIEGSYCLQEHDELAGKQRSLANMFIFSLSRRLKYKFLYLQISGLHVLKPDSSASVEEQIQSAEMQINLLQMNSMMTNDDDYMGEDERREEKEQGKFGGGHFPKRI